MNKEEAILHSLSEHYINLFILRKKYFKLNKNTLTNKLKQILKEVEIELESDI